MTEKRTVSRERSKPIFSVFHFLGSIREKDRGQVVNNNEEARPQGDQMSLWKCVQNVAQRIFFRQN
jgi:hypothetical protein